MTNKELARRLGKDPATTLHHVRRLVAAGFLEAQPARSGNRGAREVPYLSTGLSWRLDWSGEPLGNKEAVLQAFLGEVAEAGVDTLRQTRLVLRTDPVELNRRLRALFEELLESTPADPDGDLVAIYLATYPGA